MRRRRVLLVLEGRLCPLVLHVDAGATELVEEPEGLLIYGGLLVSEFSWANRVCVFTCIVDALFS